MFQRIARALIAVAVLVAPFSLIAARPAAAYGSCSILPQSRVVISAPYTKMSIRYGGNCAGVAYASWWAYHPTQGIQAVAVYGEDNAADVYDWDPVGRWEWRPSSGWDADYNDIRQNTAYTDVRLGSKAYLKVSRSGSRVTIWTRDSRYFPEQQRWNFYGGWRGVIQWRYVGYQSWHNLKSVTLNRYGVYQMTYANAVREYRVVYPSNGIVWGSTSPIVRG